MYKISIFVIFDVFFGGYKPKFSKFFKNNVIFDFLTRFYVSKESIYIYFPKQGFGYLGPIIATHSVKMQKKFLHDQNSPFARPVYPVEENPPCKPTQRPDRLRCVVYPPTSLPDVFFVGSATFIRVFLLKSCSQRNAGELPRLYRVLQALPKLFHYPRCIFDYGKK